jgi:hypothetical protein
MNVHEYDLARSTMHNFKITPFDLIIPHTVEFPATDYTTKRIIAQSWVRKRHPEGPVSVYKRLTRFDVEPPDVREFMIPKDWSVVRAKKD